MQSDKQAVAFGTHLSLKEPASPAPPRPCTHSACRPRGAGLVALILTQVWLPHAAAAGTTPDHAKLPQLTSSSPSSPAEKVNLNIPAQSMSSALTDFGAQTGLTIIVETKVSKGVKAEALHGSFTPDEALKRLLKPAGLRADYLDSKTVVIRLAKEGENLTKLVPTSGNSSLRLASADGTSTKSAENAANIASMSSQPAQQQPGGEDANKSSANPDKVSAAHLEEVVVTANKREQRLDDVGLTIATANSLTLQQRGVVDTGDLAKIVSGFTATRSTYSTPVYTLRGVGLYDYSLGSSPSVAVYVDEIARPFPVTQVAVTLDLERVEILKGPQGTLFGQSSTGGAINYIAAKPTEQFKIGGDVSYERFGKVDVGGFVSGPISDTLRARFAVRAIEGGAWQYSVSRPNDENGATRQLMARALADWEPTDRLKFSLNVNGVQDKSDTQQAQFVSNAANLEPVAGSINPFAQVDPAAYAAFTTPGSPAYDPGFLTRQAVLLGRLTGQGFAPGATILPTDHANVSAYLGGPNGDGTPLCTSNSDRCIRQAEWTADWPTSSDESYYQLALRTDYDVTDSIKLTSLTSYQRSEVDRYFDNDATTASALNNRLYGHVSNISQELRAAGRAGALNWLVGGNYDRSEVEDNVEFSAIDASALESLPGLRFSRFVASQKQTIKDYAVFANADYEVTSQLTMQGGIRYNKSDRSASYCSFDISSDQLLSKTFGNAAIVPGFGFYDLQTAFGLDPAGHIILQPGQCHVLNDVAPPTDPHFFRPTVVPWNESLSEHNVSFRFGTSFKTEAGSLLYATVSQGYKAGVLPGIAPAVTSQYRPAVQEKVIAYEAGVKAPLLDRRVQLNAAGFYYDYRNKQVRSRVLDPVFGLEEKMVNVPQSNIWGLESEVIARPVDRLTLSVSGTYLESRVTDTFATFGGKPVYNQAGYTGDFKGSELPYTPRFSGVADAEYRVSVTGALDFIIGTTATYAARDNTTFHTNVLKADGFFRRAHTLVDLRAGVTNSDGTWTLSAFVRNLTNKYYETSIYTSDVGYRYSGLPRIYGLQLIVRPN